MKTRPLSLVLAFVIAIFAARARAADPLPSWNDTAAKQSVIAFVEKVTGKDSLNQVYQAMLQLLAYLRTNDFKTFIVSGGGIDFMRVFAEETSGIPPEQVIGSSIKANYEVRDGKPVLIKIPELDFIDDKSGKPVGIYQQIGRRPIFAAGNSDGDFEMLEWTTAGEGARLGLLVHHTDAEREYAYDRESHFGKLDKGLAAAEAKGWIVTDMKADWKTIFSATPLGPDN